MSFPEELKKVLFEGDSFLVTTHVNPDGDAVGSVLALGLALTGLGKRCELVVPRGVPALYRFLPGAGMARANPGGGPYACGVVLDCADLERPGPEVARHLASCAFLVNIDHHASNKHFGSLNIVDREAAATGEILYELLEFLGLTITPEIASNLYTALVTDTGSFQFANTTARSYRTAARLLEYGADHNTVQNLLFRQHSLTSLRLLGRCLGTLEVSPSKKVAWMWVTRQFLAETGSSLEECEGFADYPKSVAGVEVGVLFKEVAAGEVRVSLRSKNYLDVNEVAARFGGGGHERAAGCTLHGSLGEVQEKVIGFLETCFSREREVYADGRTD